MRRTVAVMALLWCVLPAWAEEKDLAPPYGYTKESPNKEWVFVMLPPSSAMKDVPKLYVNETKKLMEKYPQAGLYKNDGSSTPVWTVDWYSFRVYPANDGVHVTSVSAESTFTAQYIANSLSDEEVNKQLNAPALTIYEKNKVLKAYALKELVKEPDSCKRSVKHLVWLAGEAVDPTGTKLVLNTQDQYQYTFDLSTGEMISQRRTGLSSPRLPYILGGTVVLVAVFGLILIRVVKRAKVAT